jgi:LCP family protein required for cell wall assembly
MNKLNTAYSFGGAALTVRTVEANTHVRIDHYIEVNFLGFTKIVDALGGVTVCTPTPINDPVHYDPATGGYVGSGLQLPAGRTTVNGVRALEYVRAREFDPRADLGRIERQQKFMSAMIQKAKSTGVLLNPVRLYDVIGAVSHSLTTDEGFGAEQIYTLLMHLRSMSPAHVQMLTVPLEPGSFNTPVGNVVKWDPVASRQLFRDLSEDKPIGGHGAHKVTIPPSSIALKVLNATTTNGFAAKAAQDLAARGFRISGTGNAPNGSDPNTTVVRYGPSRADSAKTVAASVPGAKLVQDPSLGAGVELVLGHDYKGTAPVKVAADTQNGNPPRTAAQDVCS